jgi:hypothetical protein
MAEDLRAVTMDLGRYKSVQERLGQDPNLVLTVAISGGGERSANFAVGVLLELENLRYKQSNALKEIDYFSTVSGGGMAAGGYISELADYAKEHGSCEGFNFNVAFTNCCHGPGTCKQSLKEFLKRSYHSSILRTFLPGRELFSPTARGDFFEQALDKYVLGCADHPRSSLTLGDMFVPKGAAAGVAAPYWIPNATVLGNGAIFQFVPDVLEQYGVSHFYHNLKKTHLRCPYDLPLSVGLKASASIPVALPSSTLQLSNRTTKTFLQLADGGLADNLGVFTGLQVFKGSPSNATKVLLVIDAYTGDGLPFDPKENSPSTAAMALRSVDISLDAWRGRYRELIEDLCHQRGVEVIFLSFDELIDRADQTPERDCSACYEFVKQDAPSEKLLSPKEFTKRLQAVQDAARHVPTNLSLKAREQELLLTAGRLVVCLHAGIIREKLKWIEPEVGKSQ